MYFGKINFFSLTKVGMSGPRPFETLKSQKILGDPYLELSETFKNTYIDKIDLFLDGECFLSIYVFIKVSPSLRFGSPKVFWDLRVPKGLGPAIPW